MTAAVTVLLADDHAMFREGLHFVLGQEPGLTVVGEAATGEQALELAAALDPDVVVMDLAMPGTGGLAATRRLCEDGARARVLVLTMSEDDDSVLATLRAGASGYVVKGAGSAQLVSAIRAVAGGHAVFGPHLADRMLGLFTARGTPEPTLPELSAREQEVLALLADGLSNAEIGRVLFISPITVRNHVSRILAKLQVPNRRQAMLRSRAAGRGAGGPTG